ncbi:MAG: hypothetical protein HRT60_03265, partial [Dinoroseobacter sp.]|nr:hypothetical protein [Dinoroseobacter sp.]
MPFAPFHDVFVTFPAKRRTMPGEALEETEMAFSRFDLAAFENAKGSARLARAAQLAAICRETGFLVLEGHGVD